MVSGKFLTIQVCTCPYKIYFAAIIHYFKSKLSPIYFFLPADEQVTMIVFYSKTRNSAPLHLDHPLQQVSQGYKHFWLFFCETKIKIPTLPNIFHLFMITFVSAKFFSASSLLLLLYP